MNQRYPSMLLMSMLSCQQQTDRATAPPDSGPDTAPLARSAASTSGLVPTSFLIIPGRQVGPVSATTEAGLIALSGPENARRDTIYLAEGNFEIGTTLFNNTANQAQILWVDKRRFARPGSVLPRPARDDENNLLPGPAPRWITDQGLRLGMTLRTVEKLNGRAFAFYGFGWDVGGLERRCAESESGQNLDQPWLWRF